jgi:hypothetical protein
VSIRQLPDGTYHAIKVYMDPVTNQEVAFAGDGTTRGDCLKSLDAAIATGMKAFPGLKPVYPNQVPTSRLLAVECASERPGYEPRKPPMWVKSTVAQADGRQSTRVVDYNDYDVRKKLHRAGVTAVEGGGWYRIEAAMATLEGVQG